ncbi:MAG TPA: PAS domain-containing protein [Gaiellaceae bacterium]
MTTAMDLVQNQLIGDAVAWGGYVILVADERMKFAAVSEGACAFLGYEREELLQLYVPDIVVERREAEQRYRKFVHEGFQRGEIDLRRKDGTTATATYEATETKLSGLPYYVSVLLPK